jgi:hypothetical protein
MMSRCSLVSTLPGHQVPLQLCCFPGSHTHETSTKKAANSSQHTQDSAANTDAEGKAASSPVEHGARQVGQPQPPQLLGGV